MKMRSRSLSEMSICSNPSAPTRPELRHIAQGCRAARLPRVSMKECVVPQRGRASKVSISLVCSRIRENSDRVAHRPNSHEFGYTLDSSAFHTLEALPQRGSVIAASRMTRPFQGRPGSLSATQGSPRAQATLGDVTQSLREKDRRADGRTISARQREGGRIASSTTHMRVVLVAMAALMSASSLLAQAKPTALANEAEEVKLAREQLQRSRDQVAQLRVQHAQSGVAIERVEHPVLRFTAPLWGGHHGTVWIWGTRGRPVAVLEMFRQPDGLLWNQAFHATSDTPIKLTASNGETWTPQTNSLKIQRLSDAPTPAGRIRQMKALAQKFSAHEFWTHTDRPRHELRLLTAPVHRYEDREHHLIDGAMFIIAQGTNPEVTLFLEAVHPADEAKPVWQYGLGRTGLAEIVVLYEDKEVFRAPPLTTEVFPTHSPYWRTKSKVEDNKVEDKGVQP